MKSASISACFFCPVFIHFESIKRSHFEAWDHCFWQQSHFWVLCPLPVLINIRGACRTPEEMLFFSTLTDQIELNSNSQQQKQAKNHHHLEAWLWNLSWFYNVSLSLFLCSNFFYTELIKQQSEPRLSNQHLSSASALGSSPTVQALLYQYYHVFGTKMVRVRRDKRWKEKRMRNIGRNTPSPAIGPFQLTPTGHTLPDGPVGRLPHGGSRECQLPHCRGRATDHYKAWNMSIPSSLICIALCSLITLFKKNIMLT